MDEMDTRTPSKALPERLRHPVGPAEPCRDVELMHRVERGLRRLPDQRRPEQPPGR